MAIVQGQTNTPSSGYLQPGNALGSQGGWNQQSATDWFNQQIQQLQITLANAQSNAANGWGGSPDQISHWQDVVHNTQTQLNGYQNGLQNVTQAFQAGIDPTLINQAMSGFQQNNNPDQLNQNLQQQTMQQGQLNSQNQQLSDFNKQYQSQMFGADASGNPLSMIQALQGNTGTIGALNQFETGQTAQTFNQLLQPQIQMALGGQGLQNSGASVELNSKALAQLQMQQQQSIMNAALGAQSQQQGLQQQAVLGNIAGQQGMISNTLNTNNAYMTMQFQQQLMQQQAQIAQQLAQYNGSGGGGGIGSMIGGGLGAIVGGIAGGPQGAMAGYGLGSGIGGGIGNAVSPGSSGQGTGSLGSNFFSASSSLPSTWGSPSQSAGGANLLSSQGNPLSLSTF